MKHQTSSAADNLDHQACYAAFKAHDPRFDGRLFVGVSSTGIYCRPVCRVKMPRSENCSFHLSAAAAEAAGFRPCLKCRPELAPGSATVDALAGLAGRAALLMEEDCQIDVQELAATLDVTDRHLRRAFTAVYGVAPVQYLQTRRLLLAKSLLTDTALSVTEAAMAAGFGSIRRFNDLFRRHYRLSPRDLRKQSAKSLSANQDSVTLFLGYRPPYQWEKLLTFLAGRAIPGIESVAEGSHRRTVILTGLGGKIAGKSGNKSRAEQEEDSYRGWISVSNLPRKNSLAVTVSASLLPVLSRVLARVRQLFDLNCDPAQIFKTLSAMNESVPALVGPGSGQGPLEPGLRLPGCFDPFEMSVRAILGQQVTVKAARTLATRLAANLGQELATPFPELTHTFPLPETIAALPLPVEDRLGPLGITGARARCIYGLARAMRDGQVRLTPKADPQTEMEKLLALPGFGPWTVHYLAMRALSWPDAFPHTDYGVKKALEGLSATEVLALAENWRPWRSYATIALWDSLA